MSDNLGQKILRNQFFNLRKLLEEVDPATQAENKDFDPSDFHDVLSALATNKTTATQPKVTQLTKPQLFQALYLFAMIYLQKYPTKTISLFQYLLSAAASTLLDSSWASLARIRAAGFIFGQPIWELDPGPPQAIQKVGNYKK